jgi:hypothetical protein
MPGAPLFFHRERAEPIATGNLFYNSEILYGSTSTTVLFWQLLHPLISYKHCAKKNMNAIQPQLSLILLFL